MTAPLRPWQEAAVAEALAVPAGARRAFVAPTGTGKSVAIRATLTALQAVGRTALITTPSGEIARGMLDQIGLLEPGAEVGEAALWKAAEGAGIYSPVRLRNRLASGAVAAPDVLLVDEQHHVSSASVAVWERLVAALPGVTLLGWTATPYRGSHRETLALREWWGEPRVLLTIADAAAARYLSIPRPEVWPLLDDAGARVAAGGEYDEADLERLTKEQRALARLAARISATGWIEPAAKKWDRPTLVAVASVALAHECAEVLTLAGFPAAAVSGDTPRAERDSLLQRCHSREIALCQVQVLAEGVDMPWLRRLIDLRPLRSPVAWMQLLGRITRPVEEGAKEPEYVCGCRNAERHGYLLSGQWPARKLAQETQGAFPENRSGGGPLERGVARDALKGRQVVRVPLLGGGAADVVHLASITSWEAVDEVLAVGVPGEVSPRVYSRKITGSNGSRNWGKWAVANLDAAGYAGWTRPAPAKSLSEKMGAWWKRSAAEKGLDPSAKITRREFALLPALADTRTTLLPPDREAAAERLRNVRGGHVATEQAPVGPDLVPGQAGAALNIVSSSGAGGSSSPAPLSVLAGAQGIAPAADFSGDLEHAAVAAVEAEESEEAEKALLKEVERRAADLAAALEALEMGGPLPATWAKLRDSGAWGARVAGEAAAAVAPGREILLRTREGRESVREVARVVARGADWCLAEIAEGTLMDQIGRHVAGRVSGRMPRAGEGLPVGRYAIEDEGKLRFLIVDKRGRLWEQAGVELHAVGSARAAVLAALVAADPAEACARYGRELGVCGRCGLALTDSRSRADGIGPVCFEKPW